jgi:hypothetical protein
MKILTLVSLTFVLNIATSVFANELISKSPAGASAYFVTPVNGQTVSQKFNIKFGLKGMGIAPAGAKIANTGHHHILIDTVELPAMDKSLPATQKIRHFGGGQTETELSLEPGTHTLQLLLGNFAHIPHDKPVLSEKITITVE